MNTSREELVRYYAEESSTGLAQALFPGPEAHTPEAWEVISEEAGRRKRGPRLEPAAALAHTGAAARAPGPTRRADPPGHCRRPGGS